jgi:hypothetical protein
MKKKVEYSSNNSGGSWWLEDEHWLALEKAGWKVNWKRDEKNSWEKEPQERWLGALATSAEREGLSMKEAVEEWEEITRQSSTDAGCPCCGQPHNFSYYEDGEYKDSGPHTSYEASW